MKENKDDYCLKHSSPVGRYRLSNQIRSFIKAINFMCLFILYPFACFGMFLALKGLYLCNLNELVDSGLVLSKNLEMLFRGLTDILLILILFPFILIFINFLWRCVVKNIKKECEEKYSNEG